MSNLLNNQSSNLRNQRSLSSFKSEVGAEKVFIKDLTNKDGEPVTNSNGAQICIFMMVKGGTVLAQGIVSEKTANEGVRKEAATVAEASYVDKNTGELKSCLVLYNGVNMLEGAVELDI